MVTNTERIQANNAELREAIQMAENLPDVGGGSAEDALNVLNALIDKSITDIVCGAETIGNNAFYYCYYLERVDLLNAETISTSVFYRCHSLKTLILRSSRLCTLSNTNAFSYCYHLLGTTDATYNPNGDKDCYIYVPSALIEDYKAATNWSTYASQFRTIEGSEYE